MQAWPTCLTQASDLAQHLPAARITTASCLLVLVRGGRRRLGCTGDTVGTAPLSISVHSRPTPSARGQLGDTQLRKSAIFSVCRFFRFSRKLLNLKGISGLPGGTRTPDLLLRRQLLYPVELRAVRVRRCWKKGPRGWAFVLGVKWSERRDSNSRPSAPKADALPGCATLRQGADSTRRPRALSAGQAA
jgi:hypothetical protein